MSKFVLNEPRGQYLFEIYSSLSYVRVASYTSHTLPCLNIKHLAVKITSKDQQTLNTYYIQHYKSPIACIYPLSFKKQV